VTLPPRPDMTRLRDLARGLQRACVAGEPQALARLVAVFPALPAADIALAKAQTVIAREHGFSSWPKLKTEVEALRRKRAQKTAKAAAKAARDAARAAFIDQEVSEVTAFALRGDPVAWVARPPRYGRTIGIVVRDRVAADPSVWAKMVDMLIAGLAHPNPNVRFECAHALDGWDDGRAAPALAALLDDPVPRVRWMAMHALVCDACKAEPAPWSQDICRRIAAHLLTDPSVKVRRHAAYEVLHCAPELATRTLTAVLERESDPTTLKTARESLKRLQG
jgi:hypothetical protein